MPLPAAASLRRLSCRRDAEAGLALLALLVLLTRVPFRSQYLYGWDAVNYALALRRFDPAIEQPHLPGYPLYVALGGLVASVAREPAAAYVLLSILGSIGAVAALWLLARELLGPRLATMAALLLTVSPLFWYWGEVQSPYVFLALGSTLVAWGCWRAMDGNPHPYWLAALALGLSGGVRPDLVPFLLPLLLFTAVEGRQRLRSVVIAGAILTAAVLVWLVPLVAAMGGLDTALSLSRGQSTAALALSGRSSLLGVDSALRVAVRFAAWVIWGMGPAVVGLALVRPVLQRDLKRPFAAGFFVAWLTPATLFYLTVHLGQPGYVLTLLPALLILGVAGLSRLWERGRLRAWQRRAAWAAILGVNALLFLAVQLEPMSAADNADSRVAQALDSRLLNLSAAGLAFHDQWVAGVVEPLQRAAPACCTALVLTDPNWLRYPQYYLPAYRQYVFLPGSGGAPDFEVFANGAWRAQTSPTVVLPPGVNALLWVGQPSFVTTGAQLRLLPTPGARVMLVRLTAPLRYGGYTFYPFAQAPTAAAELGALTR